MIAIKDIKATTTISVYIYRDLWQWLIDQGITRVKIDKQPHKLVLNLSNKIQLIAGE